MRRALIFSIAMLTACQTSHPSAADATGHAATASSIDVEGLKAAMATGAYLVDVRTPQEFSGGRAPGAVNIPLGELEARLSELVDHKDAPVYLICRSGTRSGKAAGMLSAQGYQAVNVSGGTSAWAGAGYPLER